MKEIYLAIILCVGTIDKINGEVVTAEIIDKDNKIHYVDVKTTAFPCEIKEQEKFYFIYNGKTTDISCVRP